MIPLPELKTHIGCAGWTVAKEHAHLFPNKGTHLERYAQFFNAVEINATFYRLPKADTVEKWREMVPPDFRFAVKLSREITHNSRLKDLTNLPLFLERMGLLQEKLGPVLVQLPPSLSYQEETAVHFFTELRKLYNGIVVFEPRHVSWFNEPVEDMLTGFSISLVAADPPYSPQGTVPGAWPGLAYFRLHGSPKLYYSEYDEAYLEELKSKVQALEQQAPVWVIFDNTASGAAVGNAVSLKKRLGA